MSMPTLILRTTTIEAWVAAFNDLVTVLGNGPSLTAAPGCFPIADGSGQIHESWFSIATVNADLLDGFHHYDFVKVGDTIPANLLTGSIDSALLGGTYTININGNATTADSAASASTAGTAQKWAIPRTITLSGDVSGTVSLDGSTNVILTTTLEGSIANADYAISAGTAVTAENAAKLDDQFPSYYLNASNINAGTLGVSYLTGTYNIGISGNAATATTASNATNLNGQAASYYLNASNISSGTLGVSYLTGTYNISISGNAATATTATSATTAGDSDTLDGQHGSYYLSRTNHTGTQVASTISDFSSAVLALATPAAHAGAGGTAHAVATTSTAGFMSAQDKLDLTDVHSFHEQVSSTGLLSGGLLTLTGGIGFSVAAGEGHINDYSGPNTSVNVTWGTLTGSTLYNGDNWIYIDNTGTLQVFSAENTTNQYIHIGYIQTTASNTVIVGYSNIKINILPEFERRVTEFLRYGVGPRVKSGCGVSEQPNPDYLKLSISSGSWYLHLQSISQPSTTSFVKVYFSTTGTNVDTGSPNTVNTGYWNDTTQATAFALVAMTPGYWKKDLIATTPNGTVYYAYGQAEYATEQEAKDGPLPTIPDQIKNSLCYLAIIVSQEGDTTIANRLIDIRPTADRVLGFGGTSAPSTAVDHGDLTGLLDDDHTQYHTDARGDARYYQKTYIDTNFVPIAHVGSGDTAHAAATTSVAGFMSAADKTKLDAITGTNTGDQTITLTGDVTGSGTGSFATTLASTIGGNKTFSNDVIIQGNLTVNGTTTSVNTDNLAIEDNVIVLNAGETGAGVTLGFSGIEIERGTENNARFLFREADDTWVIEDTVTPGIYFKIWHEGNDGASSTLDADLLDGQHGSHYLNASNINAGTLGVSYLTGTYNISISGNAATATTATTASNATNLDSQAGTYYLSRANHTGVQPYTTIDSVSTASFLGRLSSGTGVAELLSGIQATSLLSTFVGDSGSGGTKGLVPAPVTGDAAKYLRGDGTWAAVAGSGTVTSVSVVSANGISGSVADATTTPAITLSLGAITPTSVNSIVFSGTSTPTLSVTGTSSISGTNTGDQTITLTGDVTGSGTSSFATTLSNTGVTAGTYDRVTVDAKGRVTAGLNNTLNSTSTDTTLNTGEQTVLSVSIPGGTLGTAGQIRVTLLGQLLNNSGANRAYTFRIKYGANTYFGDISGNIATGTVARPIAIQFTLFATGATNTSAIHGRITLGAATNGSVAGVGDVAVVDAINATVFGTGATDSTANQNIEVSILSNSANATQTFTRSAYSIEVL